MMNTFWQTISYFVINFQIGNHTEPNLLNIHEQFKEYCLCQCRIALFNHGPITHQWFGKVLQRVF